MTRQRDFGGVGAGVGKCAPLLAAPRSRLGTGWRPEYVQESP